ncbi:MAG: sulfotransferase [Paraglaciecola sp.]|uniref:sulfotransferase n=1 Tax=Paraglaciecola sp. TaxID=1920173 RepID=UPI003297FD7B
MDYKLNEFALLSLGRCGTTMFQNMINSHSKLHLSDECHWLRQMERSGLSYHRFAEANNLRASKVPKDSKWWEAIRALNSSLISDIGDKKCGLQYIGKDNLKRINTLYEIYPHLPTIILIRDPRNLLHSLYRTGIGYPSAAKDLNNVIDNIGNYTKKVLIVRYEEFLLTPKTCIEKICSFLQVKFEKAMLYSLENVVSHGQKLNITGDGLKLNLSLLYPLCDLVNEVDKLGYETFRQKIQILSKEELCPKQIKSKDLIINFNKTTFNGDVYTTDASTFCLGLVRIQTRLKNIRLLIKNQPTLPKLHINNEQIFDVRQSSTTEVTKYKHKNFKNIFSFLELFDKIRDCKIYLYSAGSETRDFIDKYNFINELNIMSIIDLSPSEKELNYNGFRKKIIPVPYITDYKDSIYLIPTLTHCVSAEKALLSVGIDSSKIFIVI